MRLLIGPLSSGLVRLVAVPFCLLASMVVHGFRSVLLCAFSSWLLIGASFGLQMAKLLWAYCAMCNSFWSLCV